MFGQQKSSGEALHRQITTTIGLSVIVLGGIPNRRPAGRAEEIMQKA